MVNSLSVLNVMSAFPRSTILGVVNVVNYFSAGNFRLSLLFCLKNLAKFVAHPRIFLPILAEALCMMETIYN